MLGRAMVLKGFERRLERLVEGVFARAFKSDLRLVELGRRLVRAMDTQRTVGVDGRLAAPNDFTVHLSPEDHAQFAEIEDGLVRELCDAAREHARDEGYTFLGPVSVRIEVDERQATGTFELTARFRAAEGGAGPGSLVLPDGRRVSLGEKVATIGRLSECDVVLSDSNVSRRHAEVRPSGTGYVLADLGSTNGTRINGALVKERVLSDGDEITVGSTRLRFEAS